MPRLLLAIAALSLSLSAQTPPAPHASNEDQPIKAFTLPPEQMHKAIEFARARNWLHFVGEGYLIAVVVVFILSRLGPRMAALAERMTKIRLLQAYIFMPLFMLTVDVGGLPREVYDHRLSLQYETSSQGWGSWFWDWTKGELVEFVLTGAVAWLFFSVIRRSPRRWWFYFWLVSVPIVIFLIAIEPVAIDPLFHTFEPLAAKQPALVAEIAKVTAHGGLAIPPQRMFEMNASQKTNEINAYVTGLGASRRVVVWDTAISSLTTEEILFVFGHEMGHYVLGHVRLTVAMLCAMMLAYFFLAYHAMRWMLARWGDRWRIRGMDDWAVTPLMMSVVLTLLFLSEPVMNSFHRVLEHNADVYGLEVAHGIVPDVSQAAARGFEILGNLSDPQPNRLIKIWTYDHPPMAERVRFVLDYDPWSRGLATKYVK